MNASDMFKLDWRDVGKGVAVAVFSGAALALYSLVSQDGFDIFAVDWNIVFHLAVNGAVGGFVGYLTKNFFSDSQGKLGGVL